VISSNGNVTLDASTAITQQFRSRTSAANTVTLNAARVDTGKIDAGKQINIDAYSASLGGKLTAPDINLPVHTQNAEGNIRVQPKSANL
jgi:metal-dependent amidase/aminoacylase/carboxypeptidase family protein